VLFASCEERYLGDPYFDPILAELDRRKAIAFVHPALHPKARELKLSLPLFVVEYPFDTTRAATNLIFSGTLDRYPNIRFILAHAGGTLPFLASRLATASFVDPEPLHDRPPEYVMAKLRHFWYDTALAFGPQALAALAAVADPAKIVFGSDWPYAPEATTALTVSAFETNPMPAPLQRAAVERENAFALFPRLAP
jgi:predicted TIM-barrel fold metal-dependent hydrolase